MAFYREYLNDFNYFHHNFVIYFYTEYGKYKYDYRDDYKEIWKIETIEIVDAIYEDAGMEYQIPEVIGIKIKINDIEYDCDDEWTEEELLDILESDYNIDLYRQIKDNESADESVCIQEQFEELVLKHASLVKIMKDQSLFQIVNQMDEIKEELKISKGDNQELKNVLIKEKEINQQLQEMINKLKNEKEQLMKELNLMKQERQNFKSELLNKVKKALDS